MRHLTSIEERFPYLGYPLAAVHAGGLGIARENSLEAVRQSVACRPGIIEIDVRRSRDGTLYCHHGSIPFGATFAQILRRFSFAAIQKLVGPRNRLEDILQIIPEDIGIYLDIKEPGIGPTDIAPLLANCRSRLKWIQCYSYPQLVKLMRAFGGDEDKAYSLVRLYTRLRATERFINDPPDVIENSILFLASRFAPGFLSEDIDRLIDRYFYRSFSLTSTHRRFVPLRKKLWISYDNPREIHPDAGEGEEDRADAG